MSAAYGRIIDPQGKVLFRDNVQGGLLRFVDEYGNELVDTLITSGLSFGNEMIFVCRRPHKRLQPAAAGAIISRRG